MSESSATAVRGRHHWLRWAGIVFVGVLLLFAAAVTWIVNTSSGTQWLLARVGGLLGERFAVAQVQGTLRGPLTLDGLRLETEAMRLTVARVLVDPALGALLRGTVHLRKVELQGVDVQLSNVEQEEQSADAFELQPPIDLVIDRFTMNDAQLRRDEGASFVLQRADLAGRWTAAGIELRQLDAYAPQGQVHLRGRVSGSGEYSGEAEGRFRWTVDAQTYAGQLRADTQGERLRLNLNLSQPMPASLEFSLAQSAELPWQMALRVPRFDPREQWSDSTSLRSLSASLSGDGTRSQARLSGNLVINDQPLTLRAMQIERRDEVIELETLEMGIADSPGVLRASGTVNLGENLRAALDVNWTELRIPQSWVGQTLQTHGQVHVEAGAERYRANGRLALGPPGRLADIVLDVNGSPQAVRIDALRIQQPAGYLRASGDLQFGSEIQWRLAAEADSFDPGELLAEWRGDLDLALTSNGRYAAGDVQAAFDLKRLAGTLRGRMLSGGGTLSMNTRVLAGDLQLRADASTVDFRGEGGSRWNAVLTLDVAALNDWLPQAAGSIQGRFMLSGEWPRIEVAGNAQGRALRVAGLAAEELAVSAEVRLPDKPAGVLRVDGSGIAAADFNFTRLQARVSGDERAHELDVSAMGKPLTFAANVSGGRTADGWQSSVRQLALQFADVQRLTLQQPARVAYSTSGFAVSQSCLTGGDIRLCGAGNGSAEGALQLSYTLQNVPLALANVAAPNLPLALSGEIEGRGAIGRDAHGSWTGTASLSSSAGSIAQAGLGESTPLLSYANFNLAATLDGARASATVNAQLDQRGRIAGRVMLDGVGTARTALQGTVETDIPSLAALATLTPQLANVRGRAQLQAVLAGTLDTPQISGSARVAELGAQLPMLGVQLKEGTLRADARADGAVNLSGDIAAGDGRLRFDGTWTAGDGARLTIKGERVLLADIPSARVIATPDLRVRWTEGQLRVEGDVGVPTASVNIQKLPRGTKSPRLSDDVVVVDEESAATNADSLPISAQVTIALGNEVKVSGYGLEATVDGRLAVREQPGEITRGSGDLTVAGTYKAYGQDLTIQKGRVLYADAPLDNPQLDISAVRMIDEVTAGLLIAGSAQQPRISVFSDPAMDEANALSYLVAGRPLEDVGTGEEDGSALQAAARSLGTAGGGLLAKQLGRRLGVDEVSVKDDEFIGGAAFTVGEYLSPRLFLSYGVGLFEPGEVVTLRYRLSRTLSLQAQRGSEETRAGLQYRTER